MSDIDHKAVSARRLGRALGAGFAAMTFGLLVTACDDRRDESAGARRDGEAVPAVPPKPLPQQAEKRELPNPPPVSPGAAPSTARMIGTWVVLETQRGALAGDLATGTTYRFEEGGKVTVAGAKQCAYIMEAAELKIDCGGALAAGKIEFRDAETMVWTIAEKERITLKKR